jgi:4a-hydroxytetrahydrobiopterin dehydratase
VSERPVQPRDGELGRRRGLPRATEDAILPGVSGWMEVDGALEREFTFDGFPAAIGFVNRLAEAAEAADHHPDIAISYNRVTVRWTTHSAGGITDRDRELAAQTDALV